MIAHEVECEIANKNFFLFASCLASPLFSSSLLLKVDNGPAPSPITIYQHTTLEELNYCAHN
jgi:hypothetical protein